MRERRPLFLLTLETVHPQRQDMDSLHLAADHTTDDNAGHVGHVGHVGLHLADLRLRMDHTGVDL